VPLRGAFDPRRITWPVNARRDAGRGVQFSARCSTPSRALRAAFDPRLITWPVGARRDTGREVQSSPRNGSTLLALRISTSWYSLERVGRLRHHPSPRLTPGIVSVSMFRHGLGWGG